MAKYDVLNIDQIDVIDFDDYNGYPLSELKETVRKNIAETEFFVHGEGCTELTHDEAYALSVTVEWSNPPV